MASTNGNDFLCLDEDDEIGVKCARQCTECAVREKIERNGKPESEQANSKDKVNGT